MRRAKRSSKISVPGVVQQRQPMVASLCGAAELGDAGGRGPRAAADRALQLVDVLREVALASFQSFLGCSQLATPPLDAFLAEQDVRLELCLAREQVVLTLLQ